MANAQARRSESVELAALRAREEQLAARVSQLDGEQRAATTAATAASDALIALERDAALGRKVTEAQRRRAEDEVLRTKTAMAAPWSERRRAAVEATARAHAETMEFAVANLDALIADIEADGARDAEAINAACESLVAAYAARMATEQRVFGLIGLVRPARPGDVARSRADEAVAAVQKVLAAGGEQAPALVVDPREPRHGALGVPE